MIKEKPTNIDKLNQIVSNFQLNGITERFEAISIGHINKTYKLITKREDQLQAYILQKINTHVFKNPAFIMENITRVAVHLEKRAYPKKILKPVETWGNQSFFKNGAEDYWRIFPFFENTKTVNSVDKADLAYEAAYTFGEYSRYLYDLPAESLHETIPDFHHTPLRYQTFEHAVKAAIPEKLMVAKDCVKTIHEFKYILDAYALFEQQKRITHYDTKINNVLLDQASLKGVCVIDLDTLMPGMLPYDFGDMVRTITPPVDENEKDLSKVRVRPKVLRALKTGFLDGLKEAIDPVEKDNLYHGASLIIYEQAIRFLTDYLLGDQYYPVQYETQNLVRARNQLILLEDFLKHV